MKSNLQPQLTDFALPTYANVVRGRFPGRYRELRDNRGMRKCEPQSHPRRISLATLKLLIPGSLGERIQWQPALLDALATGAAAFLWSRLAYLDQLRGTNL